MTGLRETLDDIAGEITPGDPPVELTMLRGRKTRTRRRATAIAGTAGTMALIVGAALGIPALASHPARPGGGVTASGTSPGASAGVPLMREVLLWAPSHGTVAYGDPTKVDAATMRLFDRLTCRPGPNSPSPGSSPASSAPPVTVNDSWKASAGYTAARWNAPDSQVVSCDASGGKYVLDKAVIRSGQVTSVTPTVQPSTGQWIVDVRLNAAATQAFGTLTANLYNNYFRAYERSGGTKIDSQVLSQIAIVLDGDVLSSPVTAGPITAGQVQITGPQPQGFTRAEAAALAARL